MLSECGPVLVDLGTGRALVSHVLNMLGLDVLHHVGPVPAAVRTLLTRPQTVVLPHLSVYLFLDRQKDV